MSFSRRLAAGIPAAGVTVFAALAFTGSPATAAEPAVQGGYPAVMTSPEPTADTRGNAGYGGDVAEVPADTATTPTDTVDDTPTRGNPGYGPSETPGVSSTPSTPSTTTPSTTTPSAPAGTPSTPVGVASESVAPEAPNTITPGGVKSEGTLPVTGAPLTGTLAIGGLLVAAGGAAVWYTRRRRNA